MRRFTILAYQLAFVWGLVRAARFSAKFSEMKNPGNAWNLGLARGLSSGMSCFNSLEIFCSGEPK